MFFVRRKDELFPVRETIFSPLLSCVTKGSAFPALREACPFPGISEVSPLMSLKEGIEVSPLSTVNEDLPSMSVDEELPSISANEDWLLFVPLKAAPNGALPFPVREGSILLSASQD